MKVMMYRVRQANFLFYMNIFIVMICREYLNAVRKTCLYATVDCLGMVPASP
jgi:hypothetical protein